MTEETNPTLITETQAQWFTPTRVRQMLQSVGGSGSGIDADTLDGHESAEFAYLAVANVFTAKQTVSGSAESIKIIGLGVTGDASMGYVGFYDSDGSTRRGYVGDASAGTDDVYLKADTGDLRLGDSTGTGVLVLSGGHATFSGNVTFGGTLTGVIDADTLQGNAAAYFLPAASYTAADVLSKLLTVDGTGTGLDADLLDNHDWTYFLAAGDYTAADVLTKIKTVDGAGSGLDADLLDGNSSAFFLPAASYTAADILTKLLTVDGTGSLLDADLLDGSSIAAFALLASANTFTDKQTVSGSAESIKIIGLGVTGDASIGYLAFYDSNGSTRRGYVGDASAGTDDVYLKADTGDLRLGDSTGTGVLVLSGGHATFSGNVTFSGTLTGVIDADTLEGNAASYFLPTASYTAADVLAKVLTVDGPGSGLNADLLDGSSIAAFALLASANVFTAKQTVSGLDEAIKIVGVGTTGVASIGYLAFYDSNGSTRRGFIGDSASDETGIYVRADTGNLSLGDSSGAAVIVLSGGNVTVNGNLTFTGTLTGTIDADTLDGNDSTAFPLLASANVFTNVNTIRTAATGHDILRLENTAASGRNYYLGSLDTGDFAIRDGTAGAYRMIISSIGVQTYTCVDATTNTVSNTVAFRHNTTGTAAAGFGTAANFTLESTTTSDRSAGRLIYEWVDATDATRAAKGYITAYYTTTERTAITWTATSSTVTIALAGATTVSGLLTVNSNVDGDTILGRAKIGDAGLTDEAVFSHFDHHTATNYGLKHDANGDLWVNSVSGRHMYFENNGTVFAVAGAAGIYIGGSVAPVALLTLAGSTTARSSLNIIAGTAPTTPVNGDVWFDGTNFKCRIAGATKTFTVA